MKKLIYLFLIITLLVPKQSKGQKGAEAAVAGAAVIGAIIGGAAAVKNMKERAELRATEYLLSSGFQSSSFYVRTLDFNGKKASDLSMASLITFKVREYSIENKEYVYGDKWILYGFTSHGWITQYGIDFSKVRWKLYRPNEWMDMMVEYVKLASLTARTEMSDEEIRRHLTDGFVTDKGIIVGKEKKIGFLSLEGDMYNVSDYSDEIKLVYNEGSLGIYLKETRDLVQIKRKTVLSSHNFLFYKKKNKLFQ